MTLRQALARGGAVTFATLAAIVAVDNLEAATMGTLSPDIRDSLGLSDGAIVFIVSASSAFLILGALPMGWLADRYRRGRDHRVRQPLLRRHDGAVRAGDDRRRAVLRPARCRGRRSRTRSPCRRPCWPTTTRSRRAGACRQHAEHLPGRRTGTLSPLLVGGIAAWIGGPSAVALGVHHPARSRLDRVDLRVPAARAAARPVREAGRARRGHRGGGARCRSRWRRRSPGCCRSARCADHHRRSRRWASACSPCPSWPTCSWRTSTGSARSGGARSAPSGGVAVLVTLPFVGRFYDRLYRRDPARRCGSSGWLVLPAAVLTPVQYFMPNPVGFAILGHPRRSAAVSRVRHGRADAHLGGPVPAARHGRGTRRALRLLHRRDRRGPAGRACSSTPTAPRAASSCCSSRRRSSAGC